VSAAKYRRGVSTPQTLNAREQAMAQVCNDCEATPAQFNTEQDHVHLLAAHPPNVAISHLANPVKGVSSTQLRQDLVARINTAATGGRFWSPSSFAGSCGGEPPSTVKDYITDQKQPDQARTPPRPQGQGLHPRSPMTSTRHELWPHQTHALPAAVLWDMDGTLVDTEPYWIAEERSLVELHGGVWTDEHANQLVGNDLLVSAEYILAHSPIKLTPIEVVHELLAGVVARVGDHVPWRPGARKLLASLVAVKVPCALVTMSWESLATAVVSTLPKGSFAAVITGDVVSHGKPHPEPYLAAARLLGAGLGACVAIEDSPPGVASAVAAGVPTIAVPHHVPVPEMIGAVQISTLAGLKPEDLLRLFA
jgi:HAD superfamily hydrolase (TIGR01509 family)